MRPAPLAHALPIALTLALTAPVPACAPAQRPPRRAPTSPAPSRSLSPPPIPAGAFAGDDDVYVRAQRSPTPSHDAPARFETRRIGPTAPAATPRYHGRTVDLDLHNADLPNVFRLLADVGKVNIVVGGEITGSVTLRLAHVPWDQALAVIARAKGLSVEREGNVIFVTAGGR